MAYNVTMIAKKLITKKLLVLAPLSMLVACGWVDSTGRESNSAPVTRITFADGQSADTTALNEQGSMTFIVSAKDTDGEVSRIQWQPDPVEQGDLNKCVGVANFDSDLAAQTLDSACTSADDCAVTFEQRQSAGDEVEFMVVAPQLRAPVGVTYQLDTIDNDGGTDSHLSTLCLIAINEAPDAQDDFFTVLEGQVLNVDINSGQDHLLTNDVQDDHVSNEALTVNTQPATAPERSSWFALQSNGGFTYTASLLTDRTAESAIDTFVYSVTDGTHVSNATVTVTVDAKNDPPVQLAEIPLQVVTTGVPFESDLSAFFSDEEGAKLSFEQSAGTLPVSGALSLSPDGVLSGTADPGDVGSYTIVIVASDGSEQVSAELAIDVVSNFPVVAEPVPAQFHSLNEEFEIDLSEYFTDPEGKPLIYTVNSQYTTATIEVDAQTGVLQAEFTSVGKLTIVVFASDGINTPTRIRFSVTVSNNNVAPVFRGPIRSQLARVNVSIFQIDGSDYFSDADNDQLTYSITGALPEGLTLNTTSGVLSGTPTEAGIFRRIRFVATDSFGASASSNAFFIQVSPF